MFKYKQHFVALKPESNKTIKQNWAGNLRHVYLRQINYMKEEEQETYN